MVWYSHLLKNFPQFIVIHTVKGFGVVNKAEIDVFLELSCFSMIQRMLALGGCKSNCGFCIIEICLQYWNTFLNKCGYVIHHFNVHFSLYVFFASNLLLAVILYLF